MFIPAIGVISAINECVNLLEWLKSALHSRWSGSHQETLQGRVLQLQSDIQRLKDTLPTFYDLIDLIEGAEWRSHDHRVAELLQRLKDAVTDAEDLLHEFRSYEKKAQVEGNSGSSPFIDFLGVVIQGSFDKLNDAQLRLNHLSRQLKNMGLCGVTQRFDRVVRPETTSLLNETQIFGRDKELERVLGCLIVPRNSKRRRETCSVSALRSNHLGNGSRISSLRVLPIAGIGGVGKTTLAQLICNHQRVRSHFDLIIWICVSDDFDVKRLTKEVIQSCTGKEATADNLNTLQEILSNYVNNERLLIVLDDVWDDALKKNGQCWKRFCAPFRSVQEGSLMLVTTRCPKVTEGMCTMEPVILEGLNEDVFWDLFKYFAFGSEGSNSYPELERIGKEILPKLKGSPLAAKTLARMLRTYPEASHWNNILESEVWELKQEVREILPALRLSYIYLPFNLKKCFAFCAVHPKQYKFEKGRLAEIWVAEGYVEPEGRVPIQGIGCQYFEDLVARSFFQKDPSVGVAHGNSSTHIRPTTAQFILKNKSDFDKIPWNVRHVYVHPSGDLDNSDLLRLCKYMKLRTIICEKILGAQIGSIMGQWCTKLPRIRVICFASEDELLDGTGNWQHLQWSNGCFKK
ncbi:disease resistance protein RGA2-like [Triticum urartu]|nr:disease resistance protein RGA2-like [Triticum urartu]